LKLVSQLEDSAFNASVTGWHLRDWVFNDMTDAQRRKLQFSNLGDLQRHAKENCRAGSTRSTAQSAWNLPAWPCVA